VTPHQEVAQADTAEATILKRESGPFGRVIMRYTGAEGREYIVKKLQYRFHNATYRFVQTEHTIFSLLRRYAKTTDEIVVPSCVLSHDANGVLRTERSYLPGTSLAERGKGECLLVYERCVAGLHAMWARVPARMGKYLPVRMALGVYATFPLYAVAVLYRRPEDWKLIVFLVRMFYRFTTISSLIAPSYTLAHRDLTPENIVLTPNGPSIIDFEVAAIAENETDAALFPRYYYRYISIKHIISYLKRVCVGNTQRANMLRLSIFYTFQFLSFEKRESQYYREAGTYLGLLQTHIIPELAPPVLTPAERVYRAALRVVDLLRPYIANLSRHTPGPIILCYHAVDDSGWRFSTPPALFREQIQYLSTNFHIVSLETIMNPKTRKNGQIAITFDDGYESVYRYAYPILKKKHLQAAVFLIGDDKGSVHSRGNDLPLLRDDQARKLAVSGWTIGYHTEHHVHLRGCPSDTRTTEIQRGKTRMERRLGLHITHFAYPAGLYDAQSHAAVAGGGYTHAYTINGGSADMHDPWRISRVPLEGNTDLRSLQALLSPLGLWFSRVFMSMLQAKDSLEYRISGGSI
jgi:peptidoglycan/xylan/chitin deacetylase (PgdA/CDA1 family)